MYNKEQISSTPGEKAVSFHQRPHTLLFKIAIFTHIPLISVALFTQLKVAISSEIQLETKDAGLKSDL